jgi:ERCC4-type nuclease
VGLLILIDYKGGAEGKKVPLEFQALIKRIGVPAQLSDLEYGDFAFEGHGPQGSMMVGVERKTLHDMLNCIDDSRYNAQRIGMRQMYGASILALEGHWRPHDPSGVLMEGFSGGVSWGYCKYRSQRTMSAKLQRFLFSVQLSGVLYVPSRDKWHTAFNVCELYHYFQKRWVDHTSLLEVQRIAIPQMTFQPNLVRKWANDIVGLGVKLSDLAARQFRTPIKLANADESEWLRIPGIGVPTAQDIVRQVWGKK